MNVVKCTRCEHRWIPSVVKPVMCPACHSQYYDRPYVRSDHLLGRGKKAKKRR